MNKAFLFILLFVSCIAMAQLNVTWQKISTFPSTARVDFGYFVIDSNFYIVGGVDANLKEYNEVWKYNIPTNQWQQMDAFLGGIISASCGFSINGKGYISTGLINDSSQNFSCSKYFWEYAPDSDRWTRKANFPGQAREGQVSFTYKGQAYLGLGYNCFNELNDLWVYDTMMPPIVRADNRLI